MALVVQSEQAEKTEELDISMELVDKGTNDFGMQ